MKIEEKRQLVASFLEHCIAYSDASILRKKERGNDIKEIDKWLAYRDFLRITVKEIMSKELDSWLEEKDVSYRPGEKK